MDFVGTGKRLVPADITFAAHTLDVEPAVIRAVIEVECRASGFDARNRPVALFEPHQFYRRLPTGPLRNFAVKENLASPNWGQIPYPRSSDGVYAMIQRACLLHVEATLQSTSWGLGQIMGFNYARANFSSVQAMVEAMKESEFQQLLAMVTYIHNVNLDDELRRHDWAAFALKYNGPGYKKNRYDTKLASAYTRHQRAPMRPHADIPIFDPVKARSRARGAQPPLTAAPDYRYRVEEATRRWPTEWDAMKTAHGGTRFIQLFASWMHYDIDTRIGLNGKYLSDHDISDDGVGYLDPAAPIIDKDTNDRFYFFDVIVGAGGANASPGWQNISGTEVSRGNWIKPPRIHDSIPTRQRCELGLNIFGAMDMFLHERPRLLRWIQVAREEAGMRVARVGYKKGQRGASVDYWAGYVQDLQTLTISTVREFIDFFGQNRMQLSHTVFMDWLKSDDGTMMSPSEIAEMLRRFVEAESGYRHVTHDVQVFNEGFPRGGGHGGEASLCRQAGRYLRSMMGADVPIGLTSPRFHAEPFHIALQELEMLYGLPDAGGANVGPWHLPRNENRPYRREELGQHCPKYLYNNEPIGPGSSGREERNPLVIAGHYKATDEAGYSLYLFHSAQGARPNHGDLWTMPEWPRIARALKSYRETGTIDDGGGTGGGGEVRREDAIQFLPSRDRAMAMGRRVHAYYGSKEGLQRGEQGMSFGSGEPDWEGVGAWLFDVWLKAVILGKTDDEAFAEVVAEIQKTPEWKSKHP